MTNYNQRLDRVLSDYAEAMGSYVNFGSPFNSDEDNIAGAEALYQTSQDEAKQAIISLTKELVAEAKPKKHHTDVGDVYQCTFCEEHNKGIDQFEQNILKALEEV